MHAVVSAAGKQWARAEPVSRGVAPAGLRSLISVPNLC